MSNQGQSAGSAQAHSSPSCRAWASQGFAISGQNVTGKSVLLVAFTGPWGCWVGPVPAGALYSPAGHAERKAGPELRPCG